MRIKPILTEKSLKDAANGRYSFWVPTSLTKKQIGVIVSSLFDVTTKKIETVNYISRVKRTHRKKKTIRARKKAIVTVGEKESISLFGEDKKKK
ncbi:MAG: 50S ribosomal protein L23 [Candidatus Woesebacteria bacterium GW2011_GWB1_43_14]|uniref:50S ribosomal protein L23 n=1 Tax=Candidatus Woesebacteria bacterium GW2011_GWB1_43_14 TaxID=1618578 RepID=A0A0G1DII4_9BACT|nr:MAG: 50S ribosomal protein L23 [Candidatus Woesebacteria bacterium GW2011_GWA1_39_11b]KKS78018.1 MAG: 50S ribosomal protein L23 [Candidatus Woesebacteria bacterium GW2011_GWC1_42_9]KKS97402.1 MAG: 50S ribosomal protein L23 [Candidatus Woesebacteria bacterium GW2011_GWB1_43_14]